MLELRTYTKAELVEIFGTKDRQGLTRKLQRYGIKYRTSGRGENLTFTITETADPFKIFCIDELGYDGRTDFVKLRNFLYCFLNDDEFRAMPDEVKAKRMDKAGKYICRQTIADPIPVFTEVRSLLRSGKENGKFLVCVCLLYCVLLLQVGDCNIRQSFPLAPPQEGIEYPQVCSNGIVSQTRLPHRYHHPFQVSFGKLMEWHGNVYVLCNSP